MAKHTINDIANELGCSKTWVSKIYKALGIVPERTGKSFVFDDEQRRLIEQSFLERSFEKKERKPEEGPGKDEATDAERELMELLKSELAFKNREIERLQGLLEAKDSQLTDLTESLRQSHEIAANSQLLQGASMLPSMAKDADESPVPSDEEKPALRLSERIRILFRGRL